MPRSSLGAEWPRASVCMLQEGLKPRVCGVLRRPRDFACCASSFFPPKIQAHVASCLNVDGFPGQRLRSQMAGSSGPVHCGCGSLPTCLAELQLPRNQQGQGLGGQGRFLQGAVAWASQAALVVTSSPVSAGHRRLGLIPGSGGPLLKEMARTLQCSCLGSPVDRGAWRAP